MKWTPQMIARAQELRTTHNLSYEEVAEALSCECGEKLNENSVRHALRKNRGRDTIPNMAPATPIEGPSKMIADPLPKILKMTRTEALPLEDVADAIRSTPNHVRELVSDAQAEGYDLHIADGLVGRKPHTPAEERSEVTIVDAPGEERIFAVASDIHVGSKYFLKGQFNDFVHRAYEDGVRVILGPGDNLDGCYRHSRWEETHHGFHAQARYAAEMFPRLPNLSYHLITGNHDETFEEAAGVSVCQSLQDVFRAEGRDDLHMVGERAAYVRLSAPGDRRGAVVHLWHPRSAPAYARSYQLQKKIEGYSPGKKPDFLFAGHWHSQVYFVSRGVHAFASGTFHGGGGAFGNSLTGEPQIGGWVVRYRLTEKGTVRDVTPTWRGYYERETVRDVSLT